MKDCVIYGIKYDKKSKILVGTFFCAEPRELLTDIPFKKIMLKVRNEQYKLKDDGVVWQSLYQVIEEELLR